MTRNLELLNDSLVFWCVGPLFGWAVLGVLLGTPIHIALGIPVSSIALFVAIQCALQIAVSPWLFAARATTSNPAGQPHRRAVLVVIWLTLACVAALLQMINLN